MALRRVKAFGSDFDVVVARSGRQQRVQVFVRGKPLLEKAIDRGETIEVVLPARGSGVPPHLRPRVYDCLPPR